ncbi:hypothetical protein BDZ94DRAFT_1003266 [Collybia nuda]|uniref:Uncharacterized protein n=1 Tax=Collybia nuda TaxID=64659 RepID=A0A9P6CBI9_9AGAR|nr:hypothetical protein BDZ94DRAFT_1003266 [Collybia nuda]
MPSTFHTQELEALLAFLGRITCEPDPGPPLLNLRSYNAYKISIYRDRSVARSYSKHRGRVVATKNNLGRPLGETWVCFNGHDSSLLVLGTLF